MQIKEGDYLFPIKYDKKYKKDLDAIDAFINDVKNWNYERVEPSHIFELGKTNKVHYFGTTHIYEEKCPLDKEPMAKKLHDDLYAFADKVKNDFVILIEDWERVDFKSANEGFNTKGERGLLLYWGKELGVDVIPTDFNHPKCEHMQVLSKYFSYENMVLFIFLYRVKAWTTDDWDTQENFEKYIVEKVNKNLEPASIKPITYEYLDNLHKQKFGQSILERKDISAWKDLDVSIENNELNEIFKEYHMLRERNFLYQIITNYRQGKNVYCVYGCDHAQFTEPLLRKLVR